MKVTTAACARQQGQSVKVTADTISDDQIRQWESDVIEYGDDTEKREAIDLATVALGDPPRNSRAMDMRRIARIGVAAVWNARYGYDK